MRRYKFYFIAIILSLTATVAIAQKPNFLTKSEKQNGWRLLFDGKTFNGWQGTPVVFRSIKIKPAL